jgi:hypothetical protein
MEQEGLRRIGAKVEVRVRGSVLDNPARMDALAQNGLGHHRSLTCLLLNMDDTVLRGGLDLIHTRDHLTGEIKQRLCLR